MQAKMESERLYGLDWLRIGAFALLIFYHIGMFFVPWGWHVKTAEPLVWLELPMMALNPWRLALLFVISGVASRALLARTAAAGGFAASRSSRLLVPLTAGVVLFVAPQAWAELRLAGAYSGGFIQFWIEEYFRFGGLHGVILPTWNHLWFVAYLWLYSMALALLASIPAKARERMQRAFDASFAGWRLLILPVFYLAAARIFLYPPFGETHALLDDPYAHAVYAFAFFFGVGLAGSRRTWDLIARQWRTALAIAIVAYAVVVLLAAGSAGEAGDLNLLVHRTVRSIQAWGAILGLLGLARLYLHRDGPARRYLTEAIFPYYIAHQTIIVLVGYWLAPMRLGAGVEFSIILAATVAGCVLIYEIGQRIGWLRPLIGLKPKAQRRPRAVRQPAF